MSNKHADRPRPGPGPHEARERAIGLLYEAESKGMDPMVLLEELPLAPTPYAIELVTGVSHRLAEIDATLETHAEGWSVGRMPAVDRAVLRVAVFELLTDAVPRAVVIDEAVELAKEYSTENSGRFVNGVLAGVLGKRTGSSAQAVVEAHAESAPTATVASAAHDEEE